MENIAEEHMYRYSTIVIIYLWANPIGCTETKKKFSRAFHLLFTLIIHGLQFLLLKKNRFRQGADHSWVSVR